MRARLSIIAFAIAVVIASIGAGTAASQPDQNAGTPVLWRDAGPIGEKDVLGGAGGRDNAPRPPFKFIKEDLSGSKPKVRVVDSRGTTWNVKLAGDLPQKNEVQAEIAANRLVWALGYVAEEDYLVKEGRIDDVGQLQRARSSIGSDGTFRMARFERRPTEVTRTERQWSFSTNPFVGTKELSGLEILIALINNWDNKPENTAIDLVRLDDGRVEERHLVSDWGAAFGRMAGPPDWVPSPTRWNHAHYKDQPFVVKRDETGVELNFIGQVRFERFPLDHVRWFAELAGQLKPEQIRAAFEAAGGSGDEVEAFSSRVMAKIRELQVAVANE
jgi:hypothetical protein